MTIQVVCDFEECCLCEYTPEKGPIETGDITPVSLPPGWFANHGNHYCEKHHDAVKIYKNADREKQKTKRQKIVEVSLFILLFFLAQALFFYVCVLGIRSFFNE